VCSHTRLDMDVSDFRIYGHVVCYTTWRIPAFLTSYRCMLSTNARLNGLRIHSASHEKYTQSQYGRYHRIRILEMVYHLFSS
jgi:hypothetical protein